MSVSSALANTEFNPVLHGFHPQRATSTVNLQVVLRHERREHSAGARLPYLLTLSKGFPSSVVTPLSPFTSSILAFPDSHRRWLLHSKPCAHWPTGQKPWLLSRPHLMQCPGILLSTSSFLSSVLISTSTPLCTAYLSSTENLSDSVVSSCFPFSLFVVLGV